MLLFTYAAHKPWFGQLMAAPQMLAYLLQINDWLESYAPKFVS